MYRMNTHILKQLFLPAAMLFAIAIGLTGCSATSNLPEGEQLYVGIEDINFTDKPTKKKSGRDSVGIITSINDAVLAVNDVLEGRASDAAARLSMHHPDSLTKEERRALKQKQEADAAAFATAQAEVEAVLAYPPNNAIFGSSSLYSPIQVGLWLHNGLVNSQSKMGKWIFKHFATAPVLISTVSPEMRSKVATNTLHNYGYFRGKVDYEVLTQKKNSRKAKVRYDVHAGPLYRLDSIAYLGFVPATDSLLRATMSKRQLRKGDAFSVVNLSDEQTRIEALLRENGYYYYSAPYTTFRADTLQRSGYVQLQVRPVAEIPERANKPWYMGHTYVSVRNNDTDALTGEISRRNYTYNFSGKEIPLRTGMWRHAIVHRKGEAYKLSHQKTTIEKLNALGVFSRLDVNYVPRDTTSACDTLDLYVSAVMDRLYDASFEVNAVLKSNQQVGPGVSFGLAKRNAFRGGEKVSFDIFGSYEWQTGAGSEGGNSLLNSYELGTQLAFEFPRIVFPFISRRALRFPASTTFALDADWKNRAGFFNMVSLGVSARYKWSKRPTVQHELTLLSLDFDKLMHTTHEFDSIMSANPALYVSMRDQFIPSVAYTFTYASAAHHRNPVWLQLSVKEAGNLVSGIYAATGRKVSEQDKTLFGSPFAQFVKATAELRNTFRLSRRMNIATRLFVGGVYSYGNSLRAPYAEQFYVGGANSVRAFTVRSVGPGTYRTDNSRYAYMDQTGDFRLEGNVELRARLFGSLHGAVFVDVGNVWLLRDDPARPGATLSAQNLKNLAVGTGAGLRYDLDFLVLRFDVGIGLHAPYETRKSGWYNIPRFKDGLGLHFAIGYPF